MNNDIRVNNVINNDINDVMNNEINGVTNNDMYIDMITKEWTSFEKTKFVISKRCQ